MKKMNKKGFTLVEIMIVVAIIGLLAAIGIPSIIGAYQNAQLKSAARNVAEIEKAKGVITLPLGSVTGAAGIVPDQTAATLTADESVALAKALRITPETADGIIAQLKLPEKTLSLGGWSVKAGYTAAVQ
ncbi:MAG: prepilin-type N-terminal cleavage/methylation domain-containing protein [Kiritimatiellales bacterium]